MLNSSDKCLVFLQHFVTDHPGRSTSRLSSRNTQSRHLFGHHVNSSIISPDIWLKWFIYSLPFNENAANWLIISEHLNWIVELRFPFIRQFLNDQKTPEKYHARRVFWSSFAFTQKQQLLLLAAAAAASPASRCPCQTESRKDCVCVYLHWEISFIDWEKCSLRVHAKFSRSS